MEQQRQHASIRSPNDVIPPPASLHGTSTCSVVRVLDGSRRVETSGGLCSRAYWPRESGSLPEGHASSLVVPAHRCGGHDCVVLQVDNLQRGVSLQQSGYLGIREVVASSHLPRQNKAARSERMARSVLRMQSTPLPAPRVPNVLPSGQGDCSSHQDTSPSQGSRGV